MGRVTHDHTRTDETKPSRCRRQALRGQTRAERDRTSGHRTPWAHSVLPTRARTTHTTPHRTRARPWAYLHDSCTRYAVQTDTVNTSKKLRPQARSVTFDRSHLATAIHISYNKIAQVGPAARCMTKSNVIVCTSRVQREKETPGARVPINGIELAIARWKELEKPTRSTSVAGKKLLIFILILVLESFLT